MYYVIVNAKYTDGYAVKSIDEFPVGSVMAGQERITFLETFSTIEEAQKAYPEAELSHELLLPSNTFNHLSEENNYVYLW